MEPHLRASACTPTAEAPRPETAAHHLVRRVPVAHAEDTAGDVLAALPAGEWDSLLAVYVVDDDGRLRGRAPLQEVVRLPFSTPLGDAMHRDPPHVHLREDQERVAHLALRHGLAEIPVVDDLGRLVGVVPSGALLHILRREHVEDLHRLAGIGREDHRVLASVDEPPTRRVRHRAPWLVVGLAGALVAAMVMQRFERTMDANVAVAFFVPSIVYIADAIGTQTEAIVVRTLSLANVPFRRMISGELGTGVLLGALLGGLAWPAVWLGWGDAALASTVAISVLVAGAVATSVGMLLPWALARLGRDPAFGSGPLATIVQDVLSLLIYFVVARALVL